eukprot:1288166-Rhodomonas_salina.1
MHGFAPVGIPTRVPGYPGVTAYPGTRVRSPDTRYPGFKLQYTGTRTGTYPGTRVPEYPPSTFISNYLEPAFKIS